MSHRYSRSEKAKGVVGAPLPRRRSPVRIPEGDNSSLIEANKLTLIGRVTNPSIQKPRAVVNYFPSFWNLDTVVTGRPLGLDRFQFKFETEEALHSVLRKAPYHYKQWMLILQRWEPIVADNFPALIPFWIRIHGLPPHHWSSQTIRTIGCELGHITGADTGIDVTEGRIRVQVNGLNPLEVSLPILLPTGEETTVEIEYEKLEKHCFNCFSLSHEVIDCPTKESYYKNPTRPLGINQQKTLYKIEADKKRANLKRDRSQRSHSPPTRRLLSTDRSSRRWAPYDTKRQERNRYPSDRYHGQPAHYGSSHQRSTYRSPTSHKTELASSHSTPSPAHGDGERFRQSSRSSNPRDATLLPSSGGQRDNTKIPTPLPLSNKLLHIENTAGEVGESSSGSRNRRPALERLSHDSHVLPSRSSGRGSAGSGRLQDVEIQYTPDMVEEDLRLNLNISEPRRSEPTSRTLFNTLPNLSPSSMRSEQRIHTSLRLGPVETTFNTEYEVDQATTSRTIAPKSSRKRRGGSSAAAPKAVRSPLHGVTLRQRIATKTHTSPAKRLCVEKTQNKNQQKSKAKRGKAQAGSDQPPISLFPASSKGTADFRIPQPPLP